MSDAPLSAHSLAEAQCFLMVTPCPNCASGPLEPGDNVVEEQHIDAIVRILARCRACDHVVSQHFRIDSNHALPSEPLVINPTTKPSSLLDVSQWLTLCHTLLASTAETADRHATRALKYHAGLCLQEALKFYEPDNELPPPTALFTPRGLAHARDHPAQFTRSRLLELRASLPTLPRSDLPAGHRPRRWWELWRR